MLYDLGDQRVQTVGHDYYVAPTGAVVGQVTLGRDVSVWFGAVVRADGAPISIGARTNVQDTAVVHVDDDAPVEIGEGVTIGHAAVVHGCRIGDYCMIGINATVLSHAEIGRYSIVGANALITERKVFPERSLIVGVPAKRVRDVTDEEIEMLKASAEHYVGNAALFRRGLKPAG